MSVELLGTRWPTPIIIAPVGSHRAYHPEGELAVARAAQSRNHLQILSTVSSTSIEHVTDAREAPVWFQLYTMGGWSGIRSRLRRAEAVGCPVVVLTVDLAGGTSPRHTLSRAIRRDTSDCAACHEGSGIAARTKPMREGAREEGPELDLTWAADVPTHGFLLREEGRVVGALTALYSERQVAGRTERFCNVATWCVLPSHRSQSA